MKPYVSLCLQDSQEASPSSSSLEVDQCVVHRRFSGNVQLPPLSWRLSGSDKARSITPEEDPVPEERPTGLPVLPVPRIDVTAAAAADSGR